MLTPFLDNPLLRNIRVPGTLSSGREIGEIMRENSHLYCGPWPINKMEKKSTVWYFSTMSSTKYLGVSTKKKTVPNERMKL